MKSKPFVDIRPTRNRPKDLICPITNENLVEAEYPIYKTDETGKQWEYDERNNVFKELSGRMRVFRWTTSKWIRVKLKFFETTIGKHFTVGSSYVKYPTTNWDGMKLIVNNFIYTNNITLSVCIAWRRVFPKKLKFPIISRVSAKTIARDLIPVQPMSAPSSTVFFIDTKVETKQKEHVIIIDDLPQDQLK